jgi:phosphoribosylanthranilate isomerase
MTKVKICGMRREADIEMAAEADYLGFVVGSISSRNLELAEAKDLMSITERNKVMVTSSKDPTLVLRMAEYLEPDVVQVHSPMQKKGLDLVADGFPGSVWALLQVGGGGEEARLKAISTYEAAILDTMSPFLGGQGVAHDWKISRQLKDAADPQPVVLAGGLNPENVQEAILAVGPFCVDVSSGVERQGFKDPSLVCRFIQRAKEGDN